jgi:hypothetical protein
VANREVAKDVRTAIEQAGEPIRAEAFHRARSEISGMARSRVPWWSMRTGVMRNTIGYIVPAQRTHGRGPRRRPNLATLLAEKEAIALEHNRDRVLDEFNDALGEVAKAWARV